MKKQFFLYSIVGLVATGTLTGLLFVNPTKAQSTTPNTPHHPANSSSSCCKGQGMNNQQQKDQHFIQMMIPHHQGAIDMADLALNQAKKPEIKQLAQAIKTTQTQEIEELKAWYKQWYGIEVSTNYNAGTPGHSGGCKMMSVMSTNLETLKTASDFDKVFIQEMIPHHQEAVKMSAMVLNSDRPELRNLAKTIIQTQSLEIEQMRQWLDTGY